MVLDNKKLKVGDKVRYLGGDVMEGGELTITEIYDIVGKDYAGRPIIKNDEGYNWHIYGLNAHCFELVDDESDCDCDTIKVETKDGVYIETTCPLDCKHDSHVVSLAKEVAELKRELDEYKEYVEKEVVLFDERLAEVKSNKPGGDRSQYITVYGTEYIEKLFGGDGE